MDEARSSAPEPYSGFNPARSIQWRVVGVFLLLILVAMEFIGAYLLSSLESYFLGNYTATMQAQADRVSRLVSDHMDQPKPEELEDLVNQVVGQPGQVFVLDRDGFIVAGSGSVVNPTGKRLPGEELVMEALGGVSRQRGTVDAETGERFQEVYAPIVAGANQPPIGVVYISASLAPLYQELADVRRILFSATAVALALVAVLAFVLARSIAAPIREITHRASLMAAGDFDQKIHIRSRDEIGQLGEMFNFLTSRLKGTLAEIAEEKQKAEAILQHMADGILALDRDGLMILVNPAARRILQLPEDISLEGRSPDTALEGLDLVPLIRRTMLARTEVSDQLVLRNPERILQAHVAPLWSDDRDITGFVVVLQDVTEREKLERLRKEFVANVSHELRTPLTTIKSYVETLLDGGVDDQEVEERFLGVIDSEADRMNRLVADLLQLSKLDYLEVRWDRRMLPVEELVDEVYEKLHGQAQAADIEFTRSYEPDLYVFGDFDRLQQVLLNLASNALKFTPPGGRVDLSARREENDFVEFAVTDTGVGIPEDDLPRVFERFYRVDKARSRELGGTGLGLSIAKEIVQAHGGMMSIKSKVGVGTRVAFTVPVRRLHTADEDHGGSAAVPGGGLQTTPTRSGES